MLCSRGRFETAPYTEPVNVGASLVDAHATPRMQPAESDEGNHKDCPYNA